MSPNHHRVHYAVKWWPTSLNSPKNALCFSWTIQFTFSFVEKMLGVSDSTLLLPCCIARNATRDQYRRLNLITTRYHHGKRRFTRFAKTILFFLSIFDFAYVGRHVIIINSVTCQLSHRIFCMSGCWRWTLKLHDFKDQWNYYNIKFTDADKLMMLSVFNWHGVQNRLYGCMLIKETELMEVFSRF